jgi:purine-nucleoside phosphorylase
MNKRFLLIGLMISFFTLSAHSQSTEANPKNTLSEILAIPTLNAKLEQIKQKELQIQQAATSSRGVNQQLQQELVQLNQAYKDLLNQELLVSKNEELTIQLKNELKKVEEQLSANLNQR